MSGLLKSHRFIGVMCAIVAGIFVAHEARGERAYLPSVGSPPLRFQAVTTNHWVFNLGSLTPAAKLMESSNSATQMPPPAANATNIVEASNRILSSLDNSNQVPARPETVTDATNDSSKPFNFGISSSTASDLLTVTPQMITEYLKPAQNNVDRTDQLGTIIFVPPELQFIPPTPKASTESRAIYKSQ